jgi:hypothetical protein
MRKLLVYTAVVLFAIIGVYNVADAQQQYKLRQTSAVMGMKSESTIYVKAMRKRTEGGGMMGMENNIVTIEQCDLKRTVKLNDKKKLYFIEPIAQGNEEVIDDDAPKTKVTPPRQNNTTPQKGGVITQWYSINDTNERKIMYGFTARHVWTSRKMKPSPDACMMKDSMLIKTDGWYIDLPQFNCPINYRPARPPRMQNQKEQPQCMDKFVIHRRGKGKLGFPLIETTTIVMGGSGPQTTEMETTIETIEFSTAKLDSMLFEIPPGYQEAKGEDELQEKMDMQEMMKKAMKDNNVNMYKGNVISETKKAGVIRIGVFAPSGDETIQPNVLQQHMVGTLTNSKIEAIAVSSEEEARKYNCDYTLNSVFTKIKSASKVGGLLKAIKNADPNAASSFNIQANLTLKAMSDGSVKSQPAVEGKYEGKIDDAAGKALDEGCKEVLKTLK